MIRKKHCACKNQLIVFESFAHISFKGILSPFLFVPIIILQEELF